MGINIVECLKSAPSTESALHGLSPIGGYNVVCTPVVRARESRFFQSACINVLALDHHPFPSCPRLLPVDVFSGKACDDPTLLTTLLQQTELMGLMQLLYAILLSGGPPRHSHSPPPLTDHTLAISMATIKALNNSAILDLKMVQVSESSFKRFPGAIIKSLFVGLFRSGGHFLGVSTHRELLALVRTPCVQIGVTKLSPS